MSIYKGTPTKDGRCYYFRKSKNGEQYTSKKYLTKEECQKAESKFILKNGSSINKRFDLVSEEFFNYLRKTKKESTYDSYKQVYNKHIYPYFKSSYINNINIQDIRKWAEMMEKKDISVNYMNIAYNTFKGIFNYAIRNYDLKSNPVQLYGRFQTKQDKIKKNKLRYITKEEFDKFISVIDDLLWKTWFITLWYTGCRKSELRALTWNNIDFNNNIITIETNLYDRSKNNKITSTKTNKDRQIIMNKELKNTLFEYKKEVMKYDDYSENWYVFGGSMYLSRTTIDRKKDYYFELSGVRRITNHEFRHSIITYLVNSYIENCNKKSINIDTEKFFIMLSKRDGHTPETLKRNYLHLFPTVQNEIVDLLDN